MSMPYESQRQQQRGASSSSSAAPAVGPSKLRQYEVFLNDVLKPDLRRASELRQKLVQEVQEYDDLDKNLAALKQEGVKPLKTLVDLGTEVLCQARVRNPTHVFINVGLGFHLECALEEAPRVIELRREALRVRLAEATAQTAKIKAHIKLVEGGLMELMGLKT